MNAQATATVRRPERRARMRGVRARRGLAAWGLALPFVALWAVFMVGPVLGSLATSFTDLHSTDLRHPLSVNLVGLENYLRLFSDQTFRQSALVTAYFVLVGAPLTMVAALAIAVALNRGVTRLRTLFRVGYYLPVVTSIVDTTHSNIAAVWEAMRGDAEWPDNAAWQALRRANRLEELFPPAELTPVGGAVETGFELPLPSVSLLELLPRGS